MLRSDMGDGIWFDGRCHPDCNTAALSRRRAETTSARSGIGVAALLPKTAQFMVHMTIDPAQCVDCGKSFRFGDPITAEVHIELGLEIRRMKRCYPACRKTGKGATLAAGSGAVNAGAGGADAAAGVPVR